MANFLGKLTSVLAAIWLILTLFLAYLYKTDNTSEVFDSTLIEEAIEEDITELRRLNDSAPAEHRTTLNAKVLPNLFDRLYSLGAMYKGKSLI